MNQQIEDADLRSDDAVDEDPSTEDFAAVEDEADETEGETPAALDELEEEELMLTEEEAAQVIRVDEVEELRTIARETRALERGVDTAGEDEFVCQSCFLVKRVSQLAGPRKKICRDCAA